jgi:hypothetical protein
MTQLPSLTERHYSVKEVAQMLALSPKAIRCQFRNEPGVLRFGKVKRGHQRDYVTLRIPASVLERVYRRMMCPGSVPSADRDKRKAAR